MGDTEIMIQDTYKGGSILFDALYRFNKLNCLSIL